MLHMKYKNNIDSCQVPEKLKIPRIYLFFLTWKIILQKNVFMYFAVDICYYKIVYINI